MSRRWTRSILLALVAGCWLGLAAPARAVFPPPVKDDGKFFSKEAIEKANKKIRQIYEKYKKDVIVETLATLTPEQQKKLEAEEKAKFFARLARDRSVELGLNGIYILFSKKPQHYQIHMDPQTQKTMFKVSDRKLVEKKIVAQFKEDDFDQGLLDGLDAIEVALKASSAPKATSAPK